MKIVKIIIPVLLLVGGFMGMTYLIDQRTDPPKRPPVVRSKKVQAHVVSFNDIPANISAFGRLKSAQPVQLYSEVKGLILEGNVPFNPGQSFKRGDVLLRIDDRQAILDLNGVKSDFLNALASVLPEIRIDFPQEYQIWQDYFDQTSFERRPIEDLPEVKNQKIKLFLSRFNVYKLFFSAQNLEISLDKHTIRAPFNGAIVSTNIRVGSTARDGSVLGDIISLDNLEVEIPVPVQDIQWIDRTRPVTFTSSEITGQWAGGIQRIGQAIDTRTQTVPIYTTISGSRNQLYDGVFLKAHMPGMTVRNAISLPLRVLYNGKFVYVVNKGYLDYKEVEIVRKETDRVIVSGGISPGDTLVMEVLQGVAPGMPVIAEIMTGRDIMAAIPIDTLSQSSQKEIK